MAQVTITINGRPYQIGCEDGQEPHLLGLANYVDGRMRDLSASVGQVGEARLLVMMSLLIADELAEASNRLEALEASGQVAATGPKASDGAVAEVEAAASERLQRAAQHLESLSARLEAG
ncbi:cell division protein ZapA [Algihabitans albus]|uniref:cell division protein ZapA n=1 Tax=Algihabitans albus TaxID=2164067 RepID=UPI000E5D7452|nr:cell division protein ZapA [Algihabitans albus]